MKNPFVYGRIVSGESFAGRKAEIKEFAGDISSGTNMIIYSPRRYGKSSLILKILGMLERRGMICIYVDLFAATDKEKFAKILAKSIAAGRPTEIADFIMRAVSSVKITLRTDAEDGGIDLEFSRTAEGIDQTLLKLYDMPEKLAQKKKKRVIVVFDEFQEISRIGGDSIERELRTKIQRHKMASYVFMGSQRAMLEEMFGNPDRPLYNIGKRAILGPISEIELVSFIASRFSKTGISASKSICRAITDATACHPYYTQQMCHEIWNFCKAGKARSISEADIDAARRRIIASQSHAYEAVWESLTGPQRALASAIASSDGRGVFSAGFVRRHGLGSAAAVQAAAGALLLRGIAEKRSGKYEITDGFFRAWLQQAG